jgi:hypothetical protein
MSVIVTDEERAGWTATDNGQVSSKEVLCECIAASESEKMITPKGKSKPVLVCSFVLKLMEIATGEEVTCYLKFNKSKAGNKAVKPDGKFAMLFRLTLGRNPRKRYSQAQHLVNHFLGEQFVVTYVIEKTIKHETYRKTISIKPIAPIVSDGWTNTGRLRHKSTSRKKPEILGKVFDEPLKVPGKVFEISLTGKAETTDFYKGSPSVSVVSKSLKANRQGGLKASNSGGSYVIDKDSVGRDNTVISSKQPKEYTVVF